MEVGVSEFPFYVEGVAVGRGSSRDVVYRVSVSRTSIEYNHSPVFVCGGSFL